MLSAGKVYSIEVVVGQNVLVGCRCGGVQKYYFEAVVGDYIKEHL